MLTINKPVQYGYRSVHDLPTPPSTSRPSPPLLYQDSGSHKAPHTYSQVSSPSTQPMSAPHRSLPPPVAMTAVQPPPGPVSSQSLAGPPISQAPPPPPPSQMQSFGQLPPAPPWQHEESMRSWLVAKTEEEKRRQEEEKTRQESYRLEQRRMEHDILRTSLSGGIPPAMVPVVFAGMGGGLLSQAALDWAQQYMFSQSQQQQQHPPALMPPGPISPDHQRRDSQPQTYAHYPPSGGVPSTPGSAQGPPSAYASGYPASPTRQRGLSVTGSGGGRPSHGSGLGLPSINTGVPGGGPGTAPPSTSHPAMPQQQQQQQPQESQSSSIYFHHWQPPTSQGSGGGGAGAGGGGGGAAGGGRGATDQPGTPSVGESPRKRKAPGPQQAAPPPSSLQRFRSPPFSHSMGLSNPPPGRRRGHSRQRSDLGSYRARGRGESFGPREASPMLSAGEASSSQQQPQQQQTPQPQPPGRSGAHTLSSLLSDNPPSPRHQQFGEASTRNSPRSSEEKTRGGGSAATRAGDND